MDGLNDTQVRAGLRSVLASHAIDLSKTNFICARGVVRMLGRLERAEARRADPLRPAELAALESEMHEVDGVVRVHFDLQDWKRTPAGHWSRDGGKD